MLAMKEMRLIFATLVRRYEATLVPGQPHRRFWRIVPAFKQGLYDVGIRPRL
jgi:cytochrome P450